MVRGLYQDRTFVYVEYSGGLVVPISRALYRDRCYEPALDLLPTKEKYEAARVR
jgi:hypothetical protein